MKKMRVLSKKLATLLLTLVFIFAMTTSTFAAWSSFQKNNVNNGTLDSTPTPPITSSKTETQISLPNNGAYYSGVDNTPVVNGSRAYTLYNGGFTGSTGGARLAATDTSGTPSLLWNYQVDPSSNNVQQLSTPYLDTAGNQTIYAATTHYNNELAGTGVSGWKDSSNNPLSSFSFPVGTTTIHYDGLVVPSDYWESQLATDILSSTASVSGTVTLTSGATSIPFGSNTYYYDPTVNNPFTLYNLNGTMVPAGTYTLTVSITTNTTLAASSFQFLTSRWALYQIGNVSTNSVGSLSKTLLASGYGQANSQIDSIGNNLYFGIFEGDRSYYQYDLGTGTLTAFKPGSGDDFYWAGSAKATVSGTDYVVFGSQTNTVYVRPTGSTFGSAAGNSFTASGTSGKIRSCICSAGSYLYYTTMGGQLVRVTTSTILGTPTTTYRTLANSSTSTPVVSSNGYIYAASSNGFSIGAVQGVQVSNFTGGILQTVYSGDPVQASVAVWSNTTTKYDYLYFTTNSSSGSGYCYSFNTITPTATQIWQTSTGTYTLQGFAADVGRLVFGNDSNTLFVIN
ncbi:hypothetical protein REC12_14900 [Desulfosporosinus sp. PR]|uniref:hypothetical protein n=1 Tax=Candidatus Desulfosporosinus nitrosoreducens TaxID=3401928 RepID=UPI0027E8130F|nr:hypothetical protein [Desulfosporosinus sp. PR]MDQ7094884.1 hypothetical protein [Desulfosporosinus sp. PR]